MALYRWRKSTIKIAMTNIMYTYYSGGVIADSDPGRYGGWSYSKEIEFNQNGQVQLTNPTNVSDEGDIAVDLDAETYFWASTGQYSATLYFAQNATRVTYQENRSRFYLESGGPVVLGTPTQSPGTFASYVYSASESAYPNGGVQGDYYYDQMMEVSPPASITVPQMVMQGKQISISWAESDGASNYILERKSSTDSSWVQVYSGANLTFSETVGTWTSVQYRVKAGGNNLYGKYTTSSVVEVIESVSIAISGTDGDLGTLTSDVSYTVSSSGTTALTVVETINGTSRTFTAANGATNKISVVDLATGYGTISIQASTNPGSGVVSVTREWTYTKTAPAFPDSGSVADLTQQGNTIWAKTIAEAVRAPGIWGGNLGLALGTLARSVLYNPNQVAKYAEVTVNLATATVGQEVNLPYNGFMVPHIVAHIGNPSASLYDSSCDGVWMLRKDIVENGVWNSSGVNTLSGSTIMQTMAGYVSNYDAQTQAGIKTVKIPYCVGNGSSTVNSGSNGLECKVFPLSGREVGLNNSVQDAVDGAKLAYFLSGDYAESQQRRIAKIDGIDSDYWIRSPNMYDSDTVNCISSSGSRGGIGVTSLKGLRPAFIMPTTFTATYYVDQGGAVHDSQEYEEAGTFTDISGGTIPMVSIETGSYVGTGTFGQSNPNTINFSLNPQMVVIIDTTTFGVSVIMVNPCTAATKSNTSSSGMGLHVTWGANSVYWYSDNSPSANKQINVLNNRYYYIAIGIPGGDNE